MQKILWFFSISVFIILTAAYTVFFNISERNQRSQDYADSFTEISLDKDNKVQAQKSFQDLYQIPEEKKIVQNKVPTVQPAQPEIKKVPSQKESIAQKEPGAKPENIQNTGTVQKQEPVKQESPSEPRPSVKQEPVVIAPAPLKTNESASPNSALSAGGVIIITSQERVKQGLSVLTSNSKLEQAAQSKLSDMFALQYFAHQSPSGKGPGELVGATGYAYILVGENLALGDFANDRDLVTAWMNSPGHRANILKSGFTEIGVAVGKGIYEGREVWMAVQEFGTPKSLCPEPEDELETAIQSKSAEINAKEQELSDLKQYLDAGSANPGSDFNAKVDEYNALISQYNALVLESRELVNSYNAEVNNFNQCMAKYM